MDGRLVAKILILVSIFFASIFVVNRIENRGVNDVSVEMEPATLPIVYVRYDDRFVNTLHGYTGKVDTTYFRETITPVNYGKTIELWADQGDERYGTYEYELRSLYQGDLLEEGKVTEASYDEGYDKLKITFRTEMEELCEYVLVLKAMDGEDVLVKYYTRVVVENDFHAGKLLDYVSRFSESLFDKKEAEKFITKSIEPNEDGNNEFLSEVDIHSSFETITFSDLKPTRATTPVPDIREIDDSYAVIRLRYLMSATENDILEYYYVTEDFRVRYVSGDKVYLLDYNRTQEQMFSPDNIDINENRFKLGIVDDKKVQLYTTEDEDRVAFVQARQLWYYDYKRGTINNIYGFCQDDNYTDSRVSYDRHNVKILKMTEEGNVVFAVYGYMNRGIHEGKVGVSVFSFEANTDRIKELIFIENDKPYDILKEDMETLMYLTGDEFYYFDNDCILRVNVTTRKSEIYVEDVLNEHLAVSDDNHLIGYPNSLLPENTDLITVKNLETQEKQEISAEKGEKLEAIGFVADNLVLGRVRESDIETTLDGVVVCPISTIDIIDRSRQVVKDYHSTGVYVMKANAKNDVVYLGRYRKINGEFTETTSDFITYKKEEEGDVVKTSYTMSDNAYNQLYLTFPSFIFVTQKPKIMMTRTTVNDDDITVKVNFEHTNPKYYAYGQGRYVTDYLNLNEAVHVAYENAGVVLNANGVIVWRKIAVKDYHTVADKIKVYTVDNIGETLDACIYMMGVYEGKNPEYAAMQEDIKNKLPVEDVILKYTGRQGTDITGCAFENGLYYLCKDAPVITRFADGTYVLVTSYNGERIRYINPLEYKDTVESRAEFEEKVKDGGSVFISYVR